MKQVTFRHAFQPICSIGGPLSSLVGILSVCGFTDFTDRLIFNFANLEL